VQPLDLSYWPSLSDRKPTKIAKADTVQVARPPTEIAKTTVVNVPPTPKAQTPRAPTAIARTTVVPANMGEGGMITPGNINVASRPKVKNPDGTVSTVLSMSFNEDGQEILIPRISPTGQVLTNAQAIAEYHKTKQHLGIFDTPAHATAYAENLHKLYAEGAFDTKLYPVPETHLGPEPKPGSAYPTTTSRLSPGTEAHLGPAPKPVGREDHLAAPDFRRYSTTTSQLSPGTEAHIGQPMVSRLSPGTETHLGPGTRTWGEVGKDLYESALGSFGREMLIGVPELAIGAADLATAGRVGKLLDYFGISTDKAREEFDRLNPPSERLKFAQEAVGRADGMVAKAIAILKNPEVIASSIGGSLPTMIVGGGVGEAVGAGAEWAALKYLPKSQRAAKVAALLAAGAGGIGEGAVTAAQQEEQIRQADPQRTTTLGQTALAGGSGALTGVIGAVSGKVANMLGIGDVDSMLAGAYVDKAARRGLVKAIVYSMIQEGGFEEFTQSIQEQIATNIANGKSWDEGVSEAAVLGMVTGAAMGAGTQVLERLGPEEHAPSATGPRPRIGNRPGAVPSPQAPEGFEFAAPGGQPRPPGAGGAGVEMPPQPGGPGVVGVPTRELPPLSDFEQERYQNAVTAVLAANSPTARTIQFALGVKTAQAHEILDRMEAEGVITAPDQDGNRQVIPAPTPAPPATVAPTEETPAAEPVATPAEPIETGEPHKFASTQADLPEPTAGLIREVGRLIVPEDALHGEGREANPHVTVKYGLTSDDVEAVRKVLKDEPPITVTLGKTSFFPSGKDDNGDVVKIDLASPDLHRLNAKIAEALPHEDTHPDYVPHITLAYVTPGRGQEFAGFKTVEGNKLTLDRLTFSTSDGQLHEIPLTGGAAPTAAATTAAAPGNEKAAKRAELAAKLLARKAAQEAAAGQPGAPTETPDTTEPAPTETPQETKTRHQKLLARYERENAPRSFSELLPIEQRAVRHILTELDEFKYDQPGRAMVPWWTTDVDQEILAAPREANAPIYNNLQDAKRTGYAIRRALKSYVDGSPRASAIVLDALKQARARIAEATSGRDDTLHHGMVLPPSAGSVPGEIYIRPAMTGQPSEVKELETIRRVSGTWRDLLAQYVAQHGHIFTIDRMADLLGAHSEGHRWANQEAVQSSAEELAQAGFEQALDLPLTEANDTVRLSGGGTASGKSEVFDAIAHAGVIGLDSTMESLSDASRNIHNAILSGRSVDVLFVYRDPIDAFLSGVVTRATNPEDGRLTDLAAHVTSHFNAPRTVLTLNDRFQHEFPAPDFKIIDNSVPETPTRDMAWLQEKADHYATRDALDLALNDAIAHAISTGNLAPDVARRLGTPEATIQRGRSEGATRAAATVEEGRQAGAESPGEVVDTLDTGEQQPRLPGEVGAVRDLEVEQPALGDVGFGLTAPGEKPVSTTQSGMSLHGLNVGDAVWHADNPRDTGTITSVAGDAVIVRWNAGPSRKTESSEKFAGREIDKLKTGEITDPYPQLVEAARATKLKNGTVSIPTLRQQFGLTEKRMADMVSRMEQDGIITRTEDNRWVLVPEAPAEGAKAIEPDFTGRKLRIDGRLEPIVGDKVFQVVPGFAGTGAHIYGEVYQGSNGLRVRGTGSASLLGGGGAPAGKTYPLDLEWTVVKDPALARMRKAREDREEALKREREAAEAGHDQAQEEERQRIIAAGGAAVTNATPVGARVKLLWHDTPTWGVVTEVGHFGPEYLEDADILAGMTHGRTLGGIERDGTYKGIVVDPNAPPAPGASTGAKTVEEGPRLPLTASAIKEAFDLTDEQAAAVEALADSIGEDFKAQLLVTKGGTPGSGALNQYVGIKAQHAAQARAGLMTARAMAMAGKSPEDIRAVTGWFEGPYDGKLRYETNDSGVSLTPAFNTLEPSPIMGNKKTLPLGEALDAPDLFALYPQLAQIQVIRQPGFFDIFGGLQGWYNHDKATINVTPYADDPRSTLLHEIQHAIQHIEGFDSGGNAAMGITQAPEALVKKATEKAITVLQERLDDLAKAIQVDKNLIVAAEQIPWAKRRDINALAAQVKQADAAGTIAYNAYQKNPGAEGNFWMTPEGDAHSEQKQAAQRAVQEALKDSPASKYAFEIGYHGGINEAIEKSKGSLARTLARVQKTQEDIVTLQAGKRADIEKVINRAGGAHELYRLISGEIEARDVEARKDLTPAQRTLAAPFTTENIAPEDAIRIAEVPATAAPSVLYQGTPENATKLRRWYYSNAEKALETWQNKGTPAQLLAHLGKFRGAMDEAKWTGLTEWLGALQSVTRAEAQAFLDRNPIEVNEVIKSEEASKETREAAIQTLNDLGFDVVQDTPEDPPYLEWSDPDRRAADAVDHDNLPREADDALNVLQNDHVNDTKYGTYQIAGGTNYREILLTKPSAGEASRNRAIENFRARRMSMFAERLAAKARGEDVRALEARHEREAAWINMQVEDLRRMRVPPDFEASHWEDAPNVLAHMRVHDRIINGVRTLYVEEFQSDWAREGRDKGFATKDGTGWTSISTGTVSPAPFVDSSEWANLALKRIVAYAAERNYGQVAWSNGEIQQRRYSLRQAVDSIHWGPAMVTGEDTPPSQRLDIQIKHGGSVLLFVAPDGQIVGGPKKFQKTTLAKVIGKALAEKILGEPEGAVQGKGLEIGGDWAVNLYDKVIPKFADAIGKPHGVKADRAEVAYKDWTHQRYVGQPVTAQQLNDIIALSRQSAETYISPITGARLDSPIGRSSVRDSAIEVRDAVEGGTTFDQAMTRYGNGALAEVFGGFMVESPRRNMIHVLPLSAGLRSDILTRGLPLFQGERASFEVIEGGQGLIRALHAPDVSSAVHEMAHAVRRFLLDASLKPEQRRGINYADIDLIEKWAGAHKGVWTTEAEEKFAKGFEAYLKDGEAPNAKLQGLFDQFRAWLSEIYAKIRAYFDEAALTPEVRALFDRIVTRADRMAAEDAAEAKEAKPPPKAKAKPKVAPSPVEMWTAIGTNAAGDTLYQDARGVRSIVKNGVRSIESVQVVPTREGVTYQTDRTGGKAATWQTTEEAAKPKAAPADAAKAAARERARQIAQSIKPSEPPKVLYQGEPSQPINMETVTRMLEMLDAYDEAGLTDFADVAQAFQEDFGAGARAFDGMLEMAWEELKGETVSVVEALKGAKHGAEQEADTPGGGPAGTGVGETPIGGPGGTGPGELAGEQPGAETAAPVQGGTQTGGERRPDGGVRGGGRQPRPARPGPAPRTGDGVDAASHVDPADTAVDPAVGEAIARGEPPRHFTIQDEKELTAGGWVTKLNNNLEALKLLKDLERTGRPASNIEQAILAKYIGWGHTNLAPVVDLLGIDNIRDPKHKEARQLLDSLLTKQELQDLGESAPNAHYSFADLPRALWAAIQHFGFKGGSILEPAIGTGHFFGTMPAEIIGHPLTRLFGIEKEPIAAGIARQLYQGAKIQNSPLQDAMLPEGYMDVHISNVPFGRIPVFDPRFAASDKALMTKSVHNYYFAKALDVARPGGLIAFVTSRYTMDSQSDAVRRYIGERAKLIGAIRMPRETFDKTAGTEVVTDIIFLQKRMPGEKPSASESQWMDVRNRDDDIGKIYDRYSNKSESVFTNVYYGANPHMVLGNETPNGKTERVPTYTVEAVDEKAPTLDKLLETIQRMPRDIYVPSTEPPRAIHFGAAIDTKQGMYVLQDGKLYTHDRGTLKPTTLKGKALAIAKTYLPVRDAYQTVLDALRVQADEPTLKAAQKVLLQKYDAFVAQHGLVNLPTNAVVIQDDPNGARVLALEFIRKVPRPDGQGGYLKGRYDYELDRKADIFDKRVLAPPVEAKVATSSLDAMIQSLAWRGHVDLDYMSQISGIPHAQLAQDLIGELYEDPVTNTFVTRDAYLSGDVVTKLAQAEARADVDPAFAAHVAALKEVQPTPLVPGQFEIPLGATYVPVEVYERFAQEQAGTTVQVRKLNAESVVAYTVSGFGGRHEFLPKFADFTQWFQDALDNKMPIIYSGTGDDRGPDQEMTDKYRESLKQLREAWDGWWSLNAATANQLTGIYNSMFNREAPRVFDGSRMITPNLNPAITLRPSQQNAAWRFLQAGNTLVDHAVGGGKTLVGIVAANELKRLGLAQKVMLPVPNGLVPQWRAAFLDAYPAAKILVTTKADFEKANRRALIARIANNNWDAIIIGHTQFESIAVSVETMRNFVREQETQLLLEAAEQANLSVSQFDDLVTRWGDKNTKKDKDIKAFFGPRSQTPQSVKDIARAILSLRTRLAKRLDQQTRDSPVVFEELGVDALIIDEFHNFKNLMFSTKHSSVAGLKSSNSGKAMDMFLKLRLVNQASGNRNIMALTGTPITNTMSEVYTVFRYLAQPVLDRLGMSGFDSWSNNYAGMRVESEPDPTGRYRERLRLRDWVNLGELSKLYRSFTDVVTTKDLVDSGQIKIPDIKNGKATIVAIEPTPEFEDYRETLKRRADNIKAGKPETPGDNSLLITTDASKAAIDMRLVDPNAVVDPRGRIPTAAREIAQRYKASTDVLGTQLVFLDIGVPKKKDLERLPAHIMAGTTLTPVIEEEEEEVDPEDVDEEQAAFDQENEGMRNLYQDLKDRLIAEGVRADEIVFLNQAEPHELGALYQAMNDGRVRVMIATRSKGGVGLNVQKRGIAVHHLDVPWRPDQLEQADARFLRHGNDNPEVEIVRYVTKRSFDAYRWKLVSIKNGNITSFKRGELASMTDNDTRQIDLDTIAAVGTGDDRHMTLVELDRELRGLQARSWNFNERQLTAKREIAFDEAQLAGYQSIVDRLTEASAAMLEWAKAPRAILTAVKGRYGMMTQGEGRAYDIATPEGRKSLQEAMEALLGEHDLYNAVKIGTAGPFDIIADKSTISQAGQETLYRAEATNVYLKIGDFVMANATTWAKADAHAPDYRGFITRETTPDKVKASLALYQQRVDRIQKNLETNREIVAKQFGQAAELADKAERVRDLRIDLGMIPNTPEDDARRIANEMVRVGDAFRAGVMGAGEHNERIEELWAKAEGLKVRERVQARVDGHEVLGKVAPGDSPREEVARMESEGGGVVDEVRALGTPTAGAAQRAVLAAQAGLGKAARALIDLYSPTVRKLAGQLASMAARASWAEQAHTYEYAVAQLWAARKAFVQLETDPAAVLTLMDAIEDPSAQNPVPEWAKPTFKTINEIYTRLKAQVEALGLEVQWREHYLARGNRWSDDPAELAWIKRHLGIKRPLEGSAAFLKQRTFPTTRDRVEATGQEPPTWNIIDLQLMKMAEMAKFIHGREFQNWSKSRGITQGGWKFIGLNKRAPKGLVRITDKAGTIYMPGKVTIREAYDKALMEGLEQWVSDLGIDYERKAGQSQTLGATSSDGLGKVKISMQAGSPETALMHEIGHGLDRLFNLGDQLRAQPGVEDELGVLGDMRFPDAGPVPEAFKEYVRRPGEQVANAVHAFIYMPEQMQEVAPQTFALLTALADERPEYEPLITLQDTRSLMLQGREHEMRLPGPILIGHYWALPEVARITNNYVGPGLAGKSAIFDAYRWFNNNLVRVLLSFSGFHALTIINETGSTRAGESLRALLQGNLGEAAKLAARTATFPYDAYRLYLRGKTLQEHYKNVAPGEVMLDEITKRIILGGQRIHMERDYVNQSYQKLRDSVTKGDFGSGLYHLVPGIIEAASIPVMEKFVPRVKLAVYYDLLERRLAELPGDPHPDTLARLATEVSDHVDNAFGEMVKDNLHWSRPMRDVLSAAMLSPTWNIGSFRGFAGAVTDVRKFAPNQRTLLTYQDGIDSKGHPIYKTVSEHWLSLRLGWAIGVLLMAAYLSNLYQWLLHGQGPTKDLKDVFHPKDSEGKRRTLPGYAKDLYSFFHRLPWSAGITVGHKLAPGLGIIEDVIRNEDYSGTEVHNWDDPIWKQTYDVAKSIGKNALPITYQNFKRDWDEGTPVEQFVEDIIGIGHASGEVDRTAAEQKIIDYRGSIHRTEAQKIDADAKFAIKRALQAGTPEGKAQAAELKKEGGLSKTQIRAATRSARMTMLQSGVKQLALDRALNVYEVATPEERGTLRAILRSKEPLIAKAAPADRVALRAKYRAAITLPFVKWMPPTPTPSAPVVPRHY
jgi:N12 class adenine-specific DNA methylase/2'-5' RNA ligase